MKHTAYHTKQNGKKGVGKPEKVQGILKSTVIPSLDKRWWSYLLSCKHTSGAHEGKRVKFPRGPAAVTGDEHRIATVSLLRGDKWEGADSRLEPGSQNTSCDL